MRKQSKTLSPLKAKNRKVKSLSRVQVFATPWTVACHAALSMGFSRQEYWNGLPFPSPLKRDCQFSANPRLGSRGGGQ